MSWLSDIVKGFNPLNLIGDVIGGVSSLITSNQTNKSAEHMTQRQIDAQKEMNAANVASQEKINAANVASQEKINQQNIDFQQGINDIMRSDSKHAISDKRADLMRAGYSTADPSLQGFTAASLTSPTLTAPQQQAPHVESEFTPQMASTLIDAKRSSLSSLTDMARTLADISLKRAQTSKTKAETSGLVKSNAWIDLEKDASYSIMLQQLDNLFKDGVIKQGQADQIANDLSSFNTRFSILQEELSSIKISNESLRDRFKAELSETLSRVVNLNADTSVKNQDARNKRIEENLLKADKELKDIEVKYAKLGIDFHGSDLFNSIARIFASGNSGEVLSVVYDGFNQMLVSLVDKLSSTVTGAIDEVKTHVKSILPF